MTKHIVAALIPVLLLAACSDTTEPADVPEAAPELDLASATGPYIVTLADGTQQLSYASPDGYYYAAPLQVPSPATWAVSDGKVCVDPPGENENVCISNGEIASDGTWEGTTGAGNSATMHRLDMTAAEPADQIAAGSYLIDIPDEGLALSVWTADGNAYLGRNAVRGTWHEVDGQHCSKLDTETVETCGTPGELNADGSFTATNADGTTLTVRML